MSPTDAVDAVQRHYPRIWHAAHRRHPARGLGAEQPSDRELTVLAHVAHDADQPVADLAEHLAIAPSTLSEVLAALEGRGWITRARDPEDRRRIVVGVTEAGRAALRAGSPLDAERLEHALASLTAAQRETVAAGLALLAEALR